MKLNIRRAWIDQPSTLQLLHNYNGVSVLVNDNHESVLQVWFLSGDTISMMVPAVCLSIGNFAPNKQKD